MGFAYSSYELDGPTTQQNGRAPGKLVVGSKSGAATLNLTLEYDGSTELVTLSDFGDQYEADKKGLIAYSIAATAYPVQILWVDTSAESSLTPVSQAVGEPPALQGTVASGVLTVGLTAEPIPVTVGQRVLLLQADSTNTGTIYLGPATVTAGTGVTSGPALAASQSWSEKVGDGVTGLSAISSAAGQLLRWLAIG